MTVLDEPVSWLAATTDDVEELRPQFVHWLVQHMKAKNLCGLPSSVDKSVGSKMLRKEYMREFIQTSMELDPDTIIEVQCT